MELSDTNEMSGIIPRTGQFIFEEVNRLKQSYGYKFILEAACFEIYCEDVRDLLNTKQVLKMQSEKSGLVVIANLTWETLTSPS